MIKGAQKQMIVVRTGDSRFFDEAYFVLRREISPTRHTEHEMLAEAGRILRERTEAPIKAHKKKGRFLLSFLLGFLIGGASTALVCLLFCVL